MGADHGSSWDWLNSLPLGMDTPVGLRGELLSAGKRQPAGLARNALAARPGRYADLVTAWHRH